LATAIRDDQVIVVGGSRHTLSIWRLDGQAAYQEVKLKVNEESNFVDVVAISTDALSVAYSASCTRCLRYESTQWQFELGSAPQSTALCFSATGQLIRGSLDGVVSSGESSISVGFPVFKLAVATNGENVAAGGLGQIVILPQNLSEILQILPNFGSPFSTFEFQPSRNRLFIGTAAQFPIIYNIRKQKVLTKIRAKFGKPGGVAMNSIVFDPKNRDRLLFVSSATAIMRHLLHPECNEFRLPYKDILFLGMPAPDVIVVFEKPWVFMMNTLPRVARAKRFLTHDEDQFPRY
jgi:hypothetical protein